MLLKLTLVLFTLFNFCKTSNIDSLTQFLLNFFEQQNQIIYLLICWNNVKVTSLSYALNKNKFPKYINVNTNFSETNFLMNINFDCFVVIDVSCKGSDNILIAANKLEKFQFPYKWLLINSQKQFNISNVSTDTYAIVLNNYDILVDSEVVCAENHEEKIITWLYYKINENRNIQRELHGEWNKTHGFKKNLSLGVTSFRRKNLDGSNIRIVHTVEHNETIHHLKDFRYPIIDTVTKAQHGILMYLMEYLNATPVNLIIVNEWAIAPDKNTGNWKGQFGYIQRKEADITGAMIYIKQYFNKIIKLTNRDALGTPIILFKNRLNVGKVLKLTNPSVLHFFFKKPSLSIDNNIYALPFSLSVWKSSILLILLIFILFILITNFENPRNQENEKVKFGNIVLLLAAAVTQQGCDVVPSGVSGRILTLFVFTAFMFLYVSYSANIVALLQSSSDSIKNINDLINNRYMKVGCANVSYNYQMFQTTTDSLRKKLYTEKIGPEGFYKVEEGMAKMREGLFAFHVEEGAALSYILKTFEEHEKCEITHIPALTEQLGWHFARFGSPQIEQFKIGLYKIGEYGIQQRFFKRFYRRIECHFNSAIFTSVGIIDFYPALLVFVYGILCSIFILIIENLTYMKYTKK